MVELKAGRVLEPVHEAQLLIYGRACDVEVGLLLNFGPVPKIKRLVFGNEKKKNLRRLVAGHLLQKLICLQKKLERRRPVERLITELGSL